MPKRTGLGRGLGSLFGEAEMSGKAVPIQRPEEPTPVKKEKKGSNAYFTKKTENVATATKPAEAKAPANVKAPEDNDTAEKVIYIPVSDIKPNSAQPRKVFSEEALQELADSIKENGVIQPIVVRKSGKGYELVAGERRWRATRKAGLKEIPAIVRVLTDRQNAFYALIENMQREDLNILEEAQGIQTIIDTYELTQDEAAKAVGKSRSYVTNALRILRLPEEVQALVNEGKLSAGHARAIAGLATKELQIEAAAKAVKEGWSVRQIESYTGIKSEHKKKPRKKSYAKDIEIRNVEEELSKALGTKVVINGSEKKGKIEIEYYSKDELDRLVENLMNN